MLAHEYVRADKVPILPLAPAGDTASWPQLGRAEEWLSSCLWSDHYGVIWGLGGHMPLFIKLTPHRYRLDGEKIKEDEEGNKIVVLDRNRSKMGEELVKIKKQKQRIWKNTGFWPWWIWHPSEEKYWGPVGLDEKRYCGIFWRLTRQKYIDNDQGEELEIYEQKWIDLYGEIAYKEAMKETETLFQHALHCNHTVEDLINNEELLRSYERMHEGLPPNFPSDTLPAQRSPRASGDGESAEEKEERMGPHPSWLKEKSDTQLKDQAKAQETVQAKKRPRPTNKGFSLTNISVPERALASACSFPVDIYTESDA